MWLTSEAIGLGEFVPVVDFSTSAWFPAIGRGLMFIHVMWYGNLVLCFAIIMIHTRNPE